MANEFFEAKRKINEIEIEYKLHDLKVDGIYVWGELRNYFFFKILNQSFHQHRRPEKSNVKNIIKIAKNSFSQAKKNDTLVVLGHRKFITETDVVGDPITFELRNLLNEYNILDDRPFNGKYLLTYNNNIYHNIDLLVRRKIEKYQIKDNDREKIEFVNEIFQKSYPDIIFRFEDVIDVISRFMIDYKYYYKSLKKQGVKKMYLSSYYSHFALLLAAKKLGVETTEIQYSAINKNHINYDFSTKDSIPYLPDNIILWSRYYDKDFLKYDNKYFINKYITNFRPEKTKKIVVISQDLIAEELHKLCLDLRDVEQLSDYEIVLKQHQWEIPVYYENIKVIDSDSKQNIIEVISDAEVVISSFSTVIDEALQLDCKVILYDNGFADIVDSNNKLDTIKNSKDIVDLLPFKNSELIKPFDNNDEDIKNLISFLNK